MDLLDEIGILCLTEEWNEPLFWGHYAVKHTGICIGFRTDRDVFKLARKIYYQENLPVVLRPQDDTDEMIRKTFLTKSSAWKYENEWRIIKQKFPEDFRIRDKKAHAYLGEEDARLLSDQRGPAIYSFDPSSVESITMGMFINPDQRNLVIESIKTAPHPITLFEAVRDEVRYKIRRKQVQFAR